MPAISNATVTRSLPCDCRKNATPIADVYPLTINWGAVFVKLKKFHTDMAAPAPIQKIQGATGHKHTPAASVARQTVI